MAMFDTANPKRAVRSSRRCGYRRVRAISTGPPPAYVSAKTVTACAVAAGELNVDGDLAQQADDESAVRRDHERRNRESEQPFVRGTTGMTELRT